MSENTVSLKKYRNSHLQRSMNLATMRLGPRKAKKLERFGRWSVIVTDYTKIGPGSARLYAYVVCDCQRVQKWLSYGYLKRGDSKQCSECNKDGRSTEGL